jgi:hypothetical protein
MGLLAPHPIELHLRGRWQGTYETALRRLAATAGVSQDRIVSHDPAMPDEMVRLASAYDVGLALEPPVSVNNDILLSNKIFTYVLAGNAVLATRTRGQSQLMSDLADAAAWCDAGRPESLASALRLWLEHRDALSAARVAAWRLGDARFNWDTEKARFLDVATAALRHGQPAQFASAGRPRGLDARFERPIDQAGAEIA